MKTSLKIKKQVLFLLLVLPVLCVPVSAAEPKGASPPAAAGILKPRNGLPNVFSKESGTPVHIVYLRVPPYEAEEQNELPPHVQKLWDSSRFEYLTAPLSESGSRLLSADLAVIEVDISGKTSFELNRLASRLEEELRLVWQRSSRTDFLFLYTDSVKESFNPPSPSVLEYLADFYGIPSLDLSGLCIENRYTDPALEGSFKTIREEEESPSFPGRETVNRNRTEKTGGSPLFRKPPSFSAEPAQFIPDRFVSARL